MRRPPKIKINGFQLSLLLDEYNKQQMFDMLKTNIFCGSCRGVSVEGIEVKEMILNSLNDIEFVGTCKVCEGSVARVFEYGEIKEFYEKAMAFRKSITK